MQPHRRQFVIGPEAVRVTAHWCCRQLAPDTWLSHCPHLRAGWTEDADGAVWGLLGLAVETLEERASPLAEIARTPGAQVPALTPSWAGRWVLVGRGQVHMDASGLLGCFYSRANQQMWVSSSPVLAQRGVPDGQPEIDPRPLRYEVGISWYTPPRSRFAGIHRLLPSQVIDLNNQSVQPRPLMPPIECDRPYEETVELLQSGLVTALRRLPEAGSKLWLGLTAGYDSRLMLALSRSAGIDVMPFTRIAARMSVGDRLLPPELARECGYDHVFISGSRDRERQPLVAQHTAGNVSDGDAEPFIQGVRDGLNGISFGGHGFSVASGFASLRLLPTTVNDAEMGSKQIAKVFQEPTHSTATAGLQEWLEWVLEHPQENLDWRDRFFIEQRQAGWLSSKEQLYDLNQLERFPILNSARTTALLLGLKEEQRLGSLVQADIIRRVCPALLNYPFNPDDRYFGFQAAFSKSLDLPQYLYGKAVSKLRWLWRSLGQE